MAIWREPSVLGVVVFGVCTITGAILIALPEYFRFYAALRESPPLPDRVEEAFEESYENLREVRDALERLSEVVSAQDKELQERKEERKNSEGGGEDPWKDEIEEAVTRLRLDCDSIEERLRPVLPDDANSPSRSLPSGMLARALSGAGKGKGFPLSGRPEGKS
ncbi:MAG: hypothetical protein ACQKBT_05175 [Puniceicoccales bacterium]